ncbi:transglycosylase family protein [Streptomyces sp. NPDC021356]|uniref:transglycosylase family protein n=1 Tax=Streptomyces sp. NPDC021356 TaxID=3154900 RepID=UPI0034108559
MLSGNGRHRRPRQAPALIVAAGVTGSAIAIPLVAASGASAADGTTWDKVAQCETGGSWSADNGNGYSGGLLLTQDDWEKYGGLSYASSADQASRSQQIAVAEKILADRGPGAWHTCGLLTGLTKSSGAADVDTGVGGDSSSSNSKSGSNGSTGSSGSSHSTGSTGSTGTSGTSGSSGSSDDTGRTGDSDGSGGSGSSGVNDPGLSDDTQSGTDDSSGSSDSSANPRGTAGSSHGTGAPGDSTTKPSPSDSSDSSGSSDSSDPSSPNQGNWSKSDTSHADGTPEGTPSAGAGDTVGHDNSGSADDYRQTAGSSALVDTGALGGGRHRGGSADEGATEGRTGATGGRHASRDGGAAHTASAASYTVRTGDSLTSIADSLDLHGGWHALYDANKGAVGADPDHIVAGQSLDVPTENAQK